MAQLVQMLMETILFSDLTEEEIQKEIIPFGRIMDIPKGNFLIHFRERCDRFGVVIKGKLNLLHIYGDGNYGIMDVLEEMDIFGVDLICTSSGISPYYAVAMQQTQVLVFPAKLVLQSGMLRDETRRCLRFKMLKLVANENMRKEYRLAILYQSGLRDRIMTYLTMQAKKQCSASFTIPFSREEMASYLCVNRICLSHELSLMEQEGIIKFHRNHFTLLNWDEKHVDYEQNEAMV